MSDWQPVEQMVAPMQPVNAWSAGTVVNATWGSIEGSLPDQIDLQDVLNQKVDIVTLAGVAFTGNFYDLVNIPQF